MRKPLNSPAELETWALARAGEKSLQISRRDIHLLLQAAFDYEKSHLLARWNEPGLQPQSDQFRNYIERRLKSEPAYRIIGYREFHGLKLQLGDATLEPRDDTETLIDAVLHQLQDKSAPLRFLDLGTGTGAVALALLDELKNAKAVATDIDPSALIVARQNAEQNDLEGRLQTSQSNWFDAVEDKFDFIVSNPPYIPSQTVQSLEKEVKLFDPPRALDGGSDGLDAYRAILEGAKAHLVENGFLALEMGFDQKEALIALGTEKGWRVLAQMSDFSGNDRAIVFQPV